MYNYNGIANYAETIKGHRSNTTIFAYLGLISVVTIEMKVIQIHLNGSEKPPTERDILSL